MDLATVKHLYTEEAIKHAKKYLMAQEWQRM